MSLVRFGGRRLKGLRSNVRKAVAVGLICATCNIAFAQDGGYYPPPQQQGYPPPQQQGYYPPPQQQGYPPPQQQGYYPPPQQQGYPPPQQQGYYPPPQQGYPPQQSSANANANTIVINTGAPQQQPHGYYQDFTSGERWGTWAINWLVPGLGSFIIMKDVTGGIVMLVLYVGGWICIANGFSTTYSSDYYSGGYYSGGYYNSYYDTPTTEANAAFYIGLAAIIGEFIYNIVRSSTYHKPHPVQPLYGSAGNVGFKMAIAPDKKGDIKTRLAYSTNF